MHSKGHFPFRMSERIQYQSLSNIWPTIERITSAIKLLVQILLSRSGYSAALSLAQMCNSIETKQNTKFNAGHSNGKHFSRVMWCEMRYSWALKLIKLSKMGQQITDYGIGRHPRVLDVSNHLFVAFEKVELFFGFCGRPEADKCHRLPAFKIFSKTKETNSTKRKKSSERARRNINKMLSVDWAAVVLDKTRHRIAKTSERVLDNRLASSIISLFLTRNSTQTYINQSHFAFVSHKQKYNSKQSKIKNNQQLKKLCAAELFSE